MHAILGELMGSIGAAIVAAAGLRYLIARPNRHMRRAKLSAIADLPPRTLGRVVGIARAVGAPLVAPLTGRKCLYYVVRISDRRGRLLFRRSEGVVFELEDGSGTATIDPHRAISALAGAQVDTYIWGPEADRRRAAYLEEHHLVTASEYDEAVIVAGATIAVFGAGERDQDGKLRIASTRDAPLIFADDKASTELELPAAQIRDH